MACKICGRNSCVEWFHSIEERQKYDDLPDDVGTLRRELVAARDEIEELKAALAATEEE
jgi:hypothetical protein